MKFFIVSNKEEHKQLVNNHLEKIGDIVKNPADCDLIVSVGGDGTLLKAAQVAISYDKPIVGINAGHLGYLCSFKIEDFNNLTIGDFKNLKISYRTLLEYSGNYAINNFCILKLNPIQAIEVGVQNVGTWKGDGVIVATGTGSSSYNQSAGGILLDQESNLIVVTPICPHLSEVKSQIINENEVKIYVSNKTNACIASDTEILGKVSGEIVIKKTHKKLKLLIK